MQYLKTYKGSKIYTVTKSKFVGYNCDLDLHKTSSSVKSVEELIDSRIADPYRNTVDIYQTGDDNPKLGYTLTNLLNTRIITYRSFRLGDSPRAILAKNKIVKEHQLIVI